MARVSLVFPILFFTLVRAPRSTLACVAVIYLYMANHMTSTGQVYPFHLPGSLAFTAEYMILFVIGILMWLHREPLARFCQLMPRPARIVLPLLIIAIFSLPNVSPSASISMVLKTFWLLVIGIGSGLFIVIAVNRAALSRFLCTPSLQWLGRISFSLYLVHEPILAALVHTVGYALPPLAVLALTIPVSLAVAALSYRLIEVPSIELGRRLTKSHRLQTA